MSKYKWLIDAGHGGMHEGKYATAPGKMHTFDDGLVIYEGVNNRAIANKLCNLLSAADIDFALIHDEDLDTPLGVRVHRANTIHAKHGNCIYLSIHSDAMPKESQGKGSGLSVWTSVGETKSDKVAEVFCKWYKSQLHMFKFRADLMDKDSDKEEQFYVLTKTNCPAVLTENLFFDNRKEAEFLLSEEGREKIAIAMFTAINEIEVTKPI
jgi:N-acetylmuramoyl-L-alanine amidase